jgi:hypothetical protein
MTTKKIFTILAIVLIQLFFGINSKNIVFADIICVDPLSPTCYKSIQEGINAAKSGDTVQVASGTYVEQVKLKSGITLQGESRDTTFIWNNTDAMITAAGISNTVVQGFTITSANGNGIYIDRSSIKIRHNIIKDCGANGVLAYIHYYYTTHNNDIENNIFKNNQTGIRYTASINFCDGHVWNNIIVENIEDGIVLEGSQTNNVKVVNNVLYSNLGDGIKIISGGNPYISNNIVMKNGNCGITQTSGAAPTVAFNDVYNNILGSYCGPVIVGPGSISVDPEFVDEAAEDFHLSDSSPVIDKGSPVNTPSDDIDGQPRPQGSGYDIGVDEIGADPGPLPCKCDLNKDGKCNILDYQVFIQAWGRTDCPIYP